MSGPVAATFDPDKGINVEWCSYLIPLDAPTLNPDPSGFLRAETADEEKLLLELLDELLDEDELLDDCPPLFLSPPVFPPSLFMLQSEQLSSFAGRLLFEAALCFVLLLFLSGAVLS